MKFERDDPANPIAMVTIASVDGVDIDPDALQLVDTEEGRAVVRIVGSWDGERWRTRTLRGDVRVRWSHRVELGGDLVGELGEIVNDEDFAAFVARNGAGG